MPCKSCGELEASCAAMREALERMLIGAKHMSCAYKPEDPDPMWHCCDWSEVVEEIEQALSTTAGRDLLERMEKLEAAIRRLLEYGDVFQYREGEISPYKQALAALDGDSDG